MIVVYRRQRSLVNVTAEPRVPVRLRRRPRHDAGPARSRLWLVELLQLLLNHQRHRLIAAAVLWTQQTTQHNDVATMIHTCTNTNTLWMRKEMQHTKREQNSCIKLRIKSLTATRNKHETRNIIAWLGNVRDNQTKIIWVLTFCTGEISNVSSTRSSLLIKSGATPTSYGGSWNTRVVSTVKLGKQWVYNYTCTCICR